MRTRERGEKTYRHSAVRCILGLGLVKFHLLLMDDGLGFGVLGSDDEEKVFSEYFCTSNLTIFGASEMKKVSPVTWGYFKTDARYVDVQGLVTFTPSFLVNKPRADAFDLNTGASLLLYILDK